MFPRATGRARLVHRMRGEGQMKESWIFNETNERRNKFKKTTAPSPLTLLSFVRARDKGRLNVLTTAITMACARVLLVFVCRKTMPNNNRQNINYRYGDKK